MRIKTVRVENFRRLRSVKIDLDKKATVCVGANNSGKTSITHIFRSFFLHKGSDLTLYDFNSGCWEEFEQVGEGCPFPVIRLDLLLEVDRQDWYRVVQLMTLQDLDREIGEVALRVEFGPREDHDTLVARYAEARGRALQSGLDRSKEKSPYSPWPENMWDYLDKMLKESYALSYHVLDPRSLHHEEPGVVVGPLENSPTAAQNLLKRLIRVDMVDAQRFLSDDSTSNGRDLSRHLRRFYQRNIDTDEVDHDALQALHESERSYEKYLDRTFKDTFDSVHDIPYPGLKSMPRLVVRSRFDNEGLLTDSASVHYEFSETGESGIPRELPERYNGLGYKNLLYMLIEIIDMYEQWSKKEAERPALHLVMIEEPEAHMHPQLQQAFLDAVSSHVEKKAEVGFHTQLVVTTHSPHIIHNTSFNPIRYFRRLGGLSGVPATEIKDLSHLQTGGNSGFLRRFLKLTNCHLFFSEAVVLAEGDAERVLLPMMIERDMPRLTDLQRAHVSILEVGGSHAFRFRPLVEFLGLPTLIITDLDSVGPDEDRSGKRVWRACRTDVDVARTCNQTLKKWLPGEERIKKLLALSEDAKTKVYGSGETRSRVRVAYQARERSVWNDDELKVAGRTFEDALLLENLDWVKEHGEKIALSLDPDATHEEVVGQIHEFVRSPKGGKTNLALTLLDLDTWETPGYIKRGLRWLNDQLMEETNL
ncbi:ATP-dependent endonuclease [Nocardiopsis sp. ATB16-24]|uniref:ATP-dependent nuclease n=1 Tax=Nocardiopsis sp. ATB16-24 TaxID=3019555 RepID=UPI0025520F75|nr:ATP-dependent endonuclease [Nocardiopsis sp. ATB16-24]